MKKKFLSKKLLSVLIICVLMASIFVPMASASSNYTIASSSNSGQVLNVYTWGATAQSGQNVTIWQSSGSNTQLWNHVPSGGYFIIRSTSNTDVSLNYNQATGKCTVYDIATNNAHNTHGDYLIRTNITSGGLADTMSLPHYTNKYLTATYGLHNGSQLYWTAPTNWNLSMWFAGN